MKMDKLFAGLIAFVAGVALSVGSAFAQTNGYAIGDAAGMKLVPYFETGDTKATIIGIQNMSDIEDATDIRNDDVTAKEMALETAKAANPVDPTTVANAEKALQDAKNASYTEHIFVGVDVYMADGTKMGEGTELCLAEGQFGFVVLQGAADATRATHQSAVLSVMDEEIPDLGYVMIEAYGNKYTSCEATGRGGLTRVLTNTLADLAALTALTDANSEFDDAKSMTAAWSIIQDVGDGFFGTEVPTTTISMESNLGTDTTAGTPDDGDPEVACYIEPTTATATSATNVTGAFMMSRCGLIPERSVMGDLDAVTTTLNTTVTARYDREADTMIYVWLAAGGDTESTRPSARRRLQANVICEDGTRVRDPDQDGVDRAINIPAPGVLTMVDASSGDLSEFTNMCEGTRGMLEFMMPDGSRAGMVFSHVSQANSHYRMNFTGYSMASSTPCTTTSDESCLGM